MLNRLNELSAKKKEEDNLLHRFLLAFPGVRKEHLHDIFNTFHDKSLNEIDRSYDPEYDDQTLQPNGQPYYVNYKNRRHVFMWVITNFSASVGTLGTFNFVGGNWYNISFRPGTAITLTSATAVNIHLKSTNEMVP